MQNENIISLDAVLDGIHHYQGHTTLMIKTLEGELVDVTISIEELKQFGFSNDGFNLPQAKGIHWDHFQGNSEQLNRV